MLKAHGYTPTIIWVKAGADIEKHKAVILTSASIVLPAQATGATAIGFTLTDVILDSYVAVQTDGVIYEWVGLPAVLTPAATYYQSADGSITHIRPNNDSVPIGFAVDENTLHIRIGGSGGGGGTISDVSVGSYYIYLDAVSITAKSILLPSTLSKKDIIDVILYGGDIHLVEGIDYSFDQSTSLALNWDAANLDPSQVSILERLKPGDRITIKYLIQV